MGLLNEINNINTTLNKKERERAEKQIKKEFSNKLYQECDSFLFDKMLQKINQTKNNYVIYLDIIKFELIDNVINEINKRYDLLQDTKSKVNFYLDNNYYKIANKVNTIYNKQQKAINFIQEEKFEEKPEKQKMSFEQKAMYLELFLNLFFFGFPILFVLYLLFQLFSL